MIHERRNYATDRTVTPRDKQIIQALITAAGQRNAKMSKQRMAEYLADVYPGVMLNGGWQSWMDFINAIMDRPDVSTTHKVVYLDAFLGVLFRETLGR